jgi:hypothetical protein
VLYELIVAEMDVGVARFYVTMNTVLAESAPAWVAHYLPEKFLTDCKTTPARPFQSSGVPKIP